MILIIPKAIDGLSALVEGLVNYKIEDIRKHTFNGKVELYLPKFKIESTLSLKEPLMQVTLNH